MYSFYISSSKSPNWNSVKHWGGDSAHRAKLLRIHCSPKQRGSNACAKLSFSPNSVGHVLCLPPVFLVTKHFFQTYSLQVQQLPIA